MRPMGGIEGPSQGQQGSSLGKERATAKERPGGQHTQALFDLVTVASSSLAPNGKCAMIAVGPWDRADRKTLLRLGFLFSQFNLWGGKGGAARSSHSLKRA